MSPAAPDETSPAGKRLPRWTRDELILALDLYLRFRPHLPSSVGPEVAELVKTLQMMGRSRLPAGMHADMRERYRNASGVSMKLSNFLRFDPNYTSGGRKGLWRGSRDEEPVWQEFSPDPARCAAVAAAIRSALVTNAVSVLDTETTDDDGLEAVEGRILTRLHRTRERDRSLSRKKRESVMRVHGKLFCEGCGLEPSRAYASLGHVPLECHHLQPLHTLTGTTKTALKDLVLLCANCHRTVHGSRPWLSMELLRSRIRLKYGYGE